MVSARFSEIYFILQVLLYTFKDNIEYLQHDYMSTWTAFEPFIYVYPVINEVVVLIKIVEKNEML